jgi:hypothetical protein
MGSLSAARARRTALAAVAITAAAASSARGVETPSGPATLGPDLSKYSDSNQSGCSTNPFTGDPTGALTCTWASVNTTDQNPLIMFGPGQISQIVVKVGAVTGPMKAVVIRSEATISLNESEPPTSSCCTDIAESQSFTPTANSTTTVPVELPVALEETAAPNSQKLTISAAYLGLSPAEGIPVPAASGVHETIEVPTFSEGPEEEPTATGHKSEEVSPSTLLEQPAMQLGAAPQTAQTGKGVLVLMDATFTPTPGASTVASLLSSHIAPPRQGSSGQPAGGPLGPAASLPAATSSFPVVTHSVGIEGHRAIFELACVSSSACSGRVSLQSAPTPAAQSAGFAARRPRRHAPKAKRVTSYGAGEFSLAADSFKSVSVELSPAGERLVRKHRILKVWVRTTVTAPKPAQGQSTKFTVRF